jgi:hypothetical protein
MTVAKFIDAANGLEVEVLQFGAAKFNAIFRDTDAGEVIGITIFATLDAASAHARNLIGSEVA